MENAPLFSVLIANYNNGCYIQETIDSILSQTYHNWEIIIVDDCSTDNSSEVYNKVVEDSRIHVFYNDANYGAGYTKKRCVDMASGDICGFVDPDDILAENDAIEVMVNTHHQFPKASMVYSGCYVTDENLHVVRITPGQVINENSALETCSWPFKHFVSFKRELYAKTDGIDPFMKRAVDYDMYYKLEEVGDIIHIDRILYKYRHNSHSISLNQGEYKSRVWHSYTCVEAMKRRGLMDERLMLFPIEDALNREYIRGIEHTRQSFSYRIGDFILKPIKLILLSIKKGKTE